MSKTLCGQCEDRGLKALAVFHPKVGRYGKCSEPQQGTPTHCPHSCGDDDEWCCCCKQPVTHERDLRAWEFAYGKFEEDNFPTVLRDHDDDGLFGPADQNKRAKSRKVFLDGSDQLLAAWCLEVAARQSDLGSHQVSKG